MIVVVIVLGVIAVAALAAVALTRRRLDAERALTATAEQQAAARAAEVAARTAELEARATELATAAGERAAATELAAERAEQARLADERAAASETAERAAVEAATAAEQRALAAESMAAERDPAGIVTPPEQETTTARDPDPAEDAAAPEQYAAEPTTQTTTLERASAAPATGLDADVLWILEQARSERTWRFSVATGPTNESVFEGAGDPLLAALQVELDAAREDVGAIVELDAELPDGISTAASVLTLRAAQELLADVVRRSEETVLRLRADADDLLIDVESVDEDGQPVLPRPLPIPPSPAVAVTETGVRIRGAFAPSPD